MQKEKGLYHQLVSEVRQVLLDNPNGKESDLIDEYLTEKHRVAFQLTRFDYQLSKWSLSAWVSKYKRDEFDDLFQYAERGYAQGYYTFTHLLKVLYDIKELGTPEAFTKKKIVESYGGSFNEEDKDSEDGVLVVKTKKLVIVPGSGLEGYNEELETMAEEYKRIGPKQKESDFDGFIQSYDNDIEIQQLIKKYEQIYKKPLRPYVKINFPVVETEIVDAVIYTLKDYKMHDELKELKERLRVCKDSQETMKVLKEYVNFY